MARADMDGKQRQKDSNINNTWTITRHFDIVIAITNITTPVHVEALEQMHYRIRDCSHHIVSVFYQKNSIELLSTSRIQRFSSMSYAAARYRSVYNEKIKTITLLDKLIPWIEREGKKADSNSSSSSNYSSENDN
ncbi:18090_t:CDS:2 [Funneliformis geosporum]|nr:18090_t:CDS:2 [Funneliformis geosporum]